MALARMLDGSRECQPVDPSAAPAGAMIGAQDGQAPEPFEIEVVPERERVVLAPRGEIDLSSVNLVRAALDELEEAGFRRIVLDLRGVTFIDSSGLRVVIEEVQKDGIDFAVIPGDERVQRVFEVVGLLDVVPVAEARSEQS